MLQQSLVLIGAALLGGAGIIWFPQLSSTRFKALLTFVGSFLFATTLIHILPELFAASPFHAATGRWILLGFLLQLFLEFFSKGIEHGHLYEEDGHHHGIRSPFSVLIPLCLHALLDGVMLVNPHMHGASHIHHDHSHGMILLGIVLHKIPAAFALVAVLNKLVSSRPKLVLYLSIFSLASPIGLWISSYLAGQALLSSQKLVALAAVAGGSFLHIATTIFFEASPDHHLNRQKLILTCLGGGLAVALGYFF